MFGRWSCMQGRKAALHWPQASAGISVGRNWRLPLFRNTEYNNSVIQARIADDACKDRQVWPDGWRTSTGVEVYLGRHFSAL